MTSSVGTPWSPTPDLVAEVARAIWAAAGDDPEGRFEQAAWRSLLTTEGPALLTKPHAPMHVTASAVVLSPDGGHTCLVLHRKLQQWVQPGGHLEEGDTSSAAAAARETQEETGLTGEVLPVPAQLSRHRAPCNPGVVDWHLDVQHVLVTGRTTPRPSDETPQVAWWPVDALPTDLAPGVGLLVARGREVLGVRGAVRG